MLMQKWELAYLPRAHAISSMKSRNLKVDDHIPKYYRKSTYISVYNPMVYLVIRLNLWVKT